MASKVVQFAPRQLNKRNRRNARHALDAAYADLEPAFTRVMEEHAADDAGILALVRFTADVLAEVRKIKRTRGAEHVEELLAALCQRARKP